MARLILGKPPDQKVFVLDKPVIRIGRTNDAEIPLKEGGVSREHARVFQVGQDFFVEDLGSKNGTWVDGARIAQRRLTPGALVQIGPYSLRFEADSPAGG